MESRRLNLSELPQVSSDNYFSGNSTSIRGKYFIPKIHNTAFYKENRLLM